MPRFDLLRVERYSSACVQATRGCPYRCEYCDVPRRYGTRPRSKPVERVVAEVVQQSGRIDYLFNNAGIGVGGEIDSYTLDDWKFRYELTMKPNPTYYDRDKLRIRQRLRAAFVRHVHQLHAGDARKQLACEMIDAAGARDRIGNRIGLGSGEIDQAPNVVRGERRVRYQHQGPGAELCDRCE